MKKIFALLLAVVMVCGLLAGCGEEPTADTSSKGAAIKTSGEKIDLTVNADTIGEESKPVETDIPDGEAHIIGVTVENSVLSIPIGTKAQIKYTVKPETAYDKSAYYVSEDESIAKVDKDGYVLGVGCGSTEIVMRTNDQGFKRTITVVVHQNAGVAEKSAEMLEFINKGREANGQVAFTAEDIALNAAANQRALEEAVDIVNNGEKQMNSKRTGTDDTIYDDFGIFVRESADCYVWGDYSESTEDAYNALIENTTNSEALGIAKGSSATYDNIAIGYFCFNDVTYWCVLMATA